jgi:hypothetical protein
VRKVFNLSNLYGAAALLLLFILPAGFTEAGMYISAIVCAVIGFICARQSMKEDGQIK